MAFKCAFHLENLNQQPATMTVTMTMEEWTHLKYHLDKHPHWVGNDLRDAISRLITKARENFTAEGAYPSGQ